MDLARTNTHGGQPPFQPQRPADPAKPLDAAPDDRNTSWEAAELLRDELQGNEKRAEDALEMNALRKAAYYHLKALRLKYQLSSQMRFSTIDRVRTSAAQVDILLRYVTINDKDESLLPPDLEALETADCQQPQHEIFGQLWAKVGLFYMRSLSGEDWKKADKYLNLSLKHLVEVIPRPWPLIAQTSQDLVDIYDLLDDHGKAEGLKTWLGKKTSDELVDKVKIDRISTVRRWCHAQKFYVERFDAQDPAMGLSALQFAVMKKARFEVETMLSFTERTSPPGNLASDLILLAANTRDSELARLLLDHGADLKVRDEDSRTVLHRCQYCPELGNQGGSRIVRLFLEKDFSLLDKQDRSGKTALYMACESGHVAMVDWLLGRGASPHIVEVNGKTPLYMACEQGNLAIVKLLLEAAARPNERGPGGCTPLVAAVRLAARKAERVDAVKELIKFHADPRILDNAGKNAFTYVGGLMAAELKRVLKEFCPLVDASSHFPRSSTTLLSSEAVGSHKNGTSEPVEQVPRDKRTGHSGGKSRASSIFSSRIHFHGSSIGPSTVRSSLLSPASRRTSLTTLNSVAGTADIGGQAANLELRVKDRKSSIQRPEGDELEKMEPSEWRDSAGETGTHLPSEKRLKLDAVSEQSSKSRTGYRNHSIYEPLDEPSKRRQGLSRPMHDNLLPLIQETDYPSNSVSDMETMSTESDTRSTTSTEKRSLDKQCLKHAGQSSLLEAFYGVHIVHAANQSPSAQTGGLLGSSENCGHIEGGEASSIRTGNQSHYSENNDDSRVSTAQAESQSSQSFELLWACPFAKVSPARHRTCNEFKLKRIRDIKQHLRRKHEQPIFCQRCKNVFDRHKDRAQQRASRDEHLRGSICEVSQAPDPVGIPDDLLIALSQKAPGRLNEYDQWYHVFRKIFPGFPSPESPYVDPTSGFVDFSIQRNPIIVSALVRSCGYTGQEAVTIETIVRMVFQDTIRQWLNEIQPQNQNPTPPVSIYNTTPFQPTPSQSYDETLAHTDSPPFRGSDPPIMIPEQSYERMHIDHWSDEGVYGLNALQLPGPALTFPQQITEHSLHHGNMEVSQGADLGGDMTHFEENIGQQTELLGLELPKPNSMFRY